MGALQGGITKVLIPESNVKDLEDIPANVKKGLEIVSVSTIDEVLFHALLEQPDPKSSDSDNEIPKKSLKTAENQQKTTFEH